MLGRLQQRAVKRRTDLQQNRHPRARLFCENYGPFNSLTITRDHDLTGRVQIGRGYNLSFSGTFANGLNDGYIQSDHSRHGAGADRDRLLHVSSALPNQCCRISQFHCARSDESGILAQAVSGDKVRVDPLRLQNAKDGRRHCEYRGLGVFCKCQLLLGSFK